MNVPEAVQKTFQKKNPKRLPPAQANSRKLLHIQRNQQMEQPKTQTSKNHNPTRRNIPRRPIHPHTLHKNLTNSNLRIRQLTTLPNTHKRPPKRTQRNTKPTRTPRTIHHPRHRPSPPATYTNKMEQTLRVQKQQNQPLT